VSAGFIADPESMKRVVALRTPSPCLRAVDPTSRSRPRARGREPAAAEHGASSRPGRWCRFWCR